LRHAGVAALEEGEKERGAARVPDEDGRLVEDVARQYFRQECPDRLHVELGVVRALDGVAACLQPLSEPRVPAVVRVAAGAVEDDRFPLHRFLLA
jgi:hypothetical protein